MLTKLFFIAHPFCFEKIMYSQTNKTYILKTECGDTGLYKSKIKDSQFNALLQ
jgi:hypothetical protein